MFDFDFWIAFSTGYVAAVVTVIIMGLAILWLDIKIKHDPYDDKLRG